MNIKKLRFCWENSTEKNMKSACLFAAGSRRNVSSLFFLVRYFDMNTAFSTSIFPPTCCSVRFPAAGQNKYPDPRIRGGFQVMQPPHYCCYCRLVEVVKEVCHMARNCKKASDSISTDCRRSNCHKIGS